VSERLGEPLIIVSSDADHCFATWDRVLINVWRGEMTLSAAERLKEAARRFIRDGKDQPLSCLSVIDSHCSAPREKVRVELARVYSELDAASVQHVWVAEGSPSRAALVLGVGLTLSTAPAPPLQLKFAVSVQEAAQMIAPRLSETSGRDAVLRSIVGQVRFHLDDGGAE